MSYLLVVEDHVEMRSQLVQWIERGLPGRSVRGVASGEAALQIVSTGDRPCAAVIDVALPGMDGIATTRLLRAQAPGLPVIVISMHGSRLYEVESRDAGADCFITKREAVESLVPALQQLLANSGNS